MLRLFLLHYCYNYKLLLPHFNRFRLRTLAFPRSLLTHVFVSPLLFLLVACSSLTRTSNINFFKRVRSNLLPIYSHHFIISVSLSDRQFTITLYNVSFPFCGAAKVRFFYSRMQKLRPPIERREKFSRNNRFVYVRNLICDAMANHFDTILLFLLVCTIFDFWFSDNAFC